MGATWDVVLQRAQANWRLLGVLGLGVLMAATLLASAPIYARAMHDLGLTYAIREELPLGAGSRIRLLDVPTDADGEALTGAVDQRIQERVGWFTSSVTKFSRIGPIPVRGETVEVSGPPPASLVQEMEGFAEHVTVVEGDLPATAGPTGPVQFVTSEEAAVALGLSVGDSFVLAEMLNDCEQVVVEGDMPTLSPCPEGQPAVEASFEIEAVLTGIVEPTDIEDPFWFEGERQYWRVIRELPGTGPIIPLWMAPGSFEQAIQARLPGYVVDRWWNVFADPELLTRANYERARDDLVALRLDFEPLGALTSTPLTLVLDEFRSEQGYRQAPLTLLLFQVSAIALFYVAIVAGVVVERQQSEIALLRSRGASIGQVMVISAWEGLLLAIPAVLIAPFLAAAATSAVGLLPVFEEVSQGDLIEVSIEPTAFLMAAVGAGLSLIALLAPAYFAARQTAVTQRRAEARPRMPMFQRYGLDLVFAAFAALLLWELSERGSAFEPSPTGGVTTDPILLASPALTIAAAGVLILRFYPMLLKAVARVVSAAGGASVAGAFWQVVRRPAQYMRLTLLVMMAVAVGTFAASYSSTATRSYEDRASYESGVDFRANGLDQTRPTSDIEAALAGLEGVENATLVTRGTVDLPSASSASRPVQMLALEPAAAAPLLYSRADFAGESLQSLLFRLQNAPLLEGIPIPETATELSVWVHSLEGRPETTLWGRIRDAEGRLVLLEFGELDDVTGWEQLTGSFAQPSTSRLRAPLSFIGFVITEPANRFNTLRFPMYLDQLVARGESGAETLLEDFEGGRTWQTLPTTDPQSDTFSITNEEVHDGSQAGLFEFKLGVNDDRRGIYPLGPSVPLVALANDSFVSQSGVGEGAQGLLRVGDSLVPYRIVGTFDLFPTMGSSESASIIFNRDQLRTWVDAFSINPTTRVRPSEAWLVLDETADLDVLKVEMRAAPFRAASFTDRESELAKVKRNPLIVAGGSGILQLSFIGILVLVGAALLLSLWSAVQRRRTEFAVLRAMGLSRGQILRQLAVEYALVGVLGLVAGVYLGTLVGRQMLSFLDVTEQGDRVEPPFILQTDWTIVGAGAAVVGLLFIAALALAVRTLARTSDAQALRTD